MRPNDKSIWGHPAIGKADAGKKVRMIDFDSYKLGINKKYNLYIAPGLSDTELRTDDKTREARETFTELYQLTADKLYGIDDIFDSIIGDDDTF